ncbi:MAG TPA: P1 family peptidase [Candidatus Acidoferrales bacterium]|nr:P1 family peptidase [Candidatus Acidoferrales bacterium]
MRQKKSNRKICGTYEKLELLVTCTKQTLRLSSNRKKIAFHPTRAVHSLALNRFGKRPLAAALFKRATLKLENPLSLAKPSTSKFLIDNFKHFSRPISCLLLPATALILLVAAPCFAQSHPPRARDLGVPFEGAPGPLDSITDVAGVEVGYKTLISGSGKLVVGKGPVRTGVTAIFPRGKSSVDPVFAGWFTENGNGEMTGTTWVEESGFLTGPVLITNTHSVGVVRDAVIAWELRHNYKPPTADWWSLPVVAETWDGYLNDINGFHVTQQDAFDAMDSAHGGAIAEGNVGGGTGMICFEFKGGTGTASRKLAEDLGGYTVGVLVQCNFGTRHLLRVAGAPVGREIPLSHPIWSSRANPSRGSLGSIIVVVATDAPLLPTQLKRLARRVTLGLGRLGSISSDGSGDIFIAFSTANAGAGLAEKPARVTMMPNDHMDPLFEATVQATEEAVVNAMVAAKTMTGIDGHTVEALPHRRLREVLKKYNRLAQ